jgi:RNA polymerase sigma-70 factor (ECF subfamily)
VRLSVERPADLVARAQAGDRAAFDALYAEHVGHVYAVCLRMTGDGTRAEHLTQDAFVRAWRSLGTFHGQSAFSTWLHRLAVNIVLEEERRTNRRERRVIGGDHLEAYDAATRPSDPEARLDLERAIAALPPGARQVLVLHDVEGYRHAEIARLMGIAVGTAKAQLHRARKLLRGMLTR